MLTLSIRKLFFCLLGGALFQPELMCQNDVLAENRLVDSQRSQKLSPDTSGIWGTWKCVWVLPSLNTMLLGTQSSVIDNNRQEKDSLLLLVGPIPNPTYPEVYVFENDSIHAFDYPCRLVYATSCVINNDTLRTKLDDVIITELFRINSDTLYITDVRGGTRRKLIRFKADEQIVHLLQTDTVNINCIVGRWHYQQPDEPGNVWSTYVHQGFSAPEILRLKRKHLRGTAKTKTIILVQNHHEYRLRYSLLTNWGKTTLTLRLLDTVKSDGGYNEYIYVKSSE